MRLAAKKRYAERFVGRTPKEFEELEDRHRKVLEILSKYELERILDVGCGDGNFTVLMARACKAKEVYGVEISRRESRWRGRTGSTATSSTSTRRTSPSRTTSSTPSRPLSS